jgi:phenylpyruvate tautomerase PptA (4-oxalocrotonate tautomerase family)
LAGRTLAEWTYIIALGVIARAGAPPADTNTKLLRFQPNPHPKERPMPFARIDLLKGKTAEYRAAVADVVYMGIVEILKAPEGDRFIVIGEHAPENLIYDQHFLGWDRSPDFILIQVTSTVGNSKDVKLAFFRFIADELKTKLSVRPDDIMINLVFVDRSDWSFGNGEPWV